MVQSFTYFFNKLNMLKGAHIKWEHVSFNVLREKKKMICSLLTNIFWAVSCMTSLKLSPFNQEWTKLCILEYQLKYEKDHWLITRLSIQTHSI